MKTSFSIIKLGEISVLDITDNPYLQAVQIRSTDLSCDIVIHINGPDCKADAIRLADLLKEIKSKQ